jgi:carbamoyl-phosphate synthase large subunit
VSKATGIPLAKIAAQVMIGRKLADLGYPLDHRPEQIAVKVPVFPFGKFPGAKVYLGPEMRSTGEVMAISESYGEAISKAFIAAGGGLPDEGGVFISVNDNDKNYELVEVAKGFRSLGFSLIATSGTRDFLVGHSIGCAHIYKVNEGRPNVVDFIKNAKVAIIVNTPFGEASRFDEVALSGAALIAKIPFITTISAAAAAVKGIQWQRERQSEVKSIQEYHHL